MKNYTKVCITICVLIIVCLFVVVALTDYQVNRGCKELGFKRYKQTENFQFCVDEGDNLHYVDVDMNGLFKVATIKEISIGDVRILGG